MTRRIAVLTLVLAACAGGSETGNPVAPPTRLSLGLYSSAAEVAGFSSGTAGTVIDEAWVSFGELVFLEGDDCAMGGDFDTTVPTLLVADLATPIEISVAAAEGNYCYMIVPLQRNTQGALPEGAPEELRDHSVVLRGRRQDGTPFILMHPERDELELVPLDGELPLHSGNRLLAWFDVAVWMDGVDLDGAVVEQDENGDDIIRIDDVNNVAQWGQFENVNLECSMQMFLDANDDARLDDDDPAVGQCPSN